MIEFQGWKLWERNTNPELRYKAKRGKFGIVSRYRRNNRYPHKRGFILFDRLMIGITILSGDRIELFYRLAHLEKKR